MLLAPLDRRLLLMLPLRRLLPHSTPPPAARKGTCLRPFAPAAIHQNTTVPVILTQLRMTVGTIARNEIGLGLLRMIEIRENAQLAPVSCSLCAPAPAPAFA